MPTDPDAYVKLVGTRIRAARKASGLTLSQAAGKLGCAVQNWQRLEKGQNVGVHMLARIANVLGVTPGALADDNGH